LIARRGFSAEKQGNGIKSGRRRAFFPACPVFAVVCNQWFLKRDRNNFLRIKKVDIDGKLW